MSELLRRLRVLLRRARLDCDIEEEMRAHLEMSAEENRENGMRPDEARYAAQRRFGNVTALHEQSREAWGWSAIESLAKDVKLAVRALRRNLAFSALAILTLALGIGANTAVFSVVQGVLLRPLSFHDPDRLVMVWDKWPKRGDDRVFVSSPEFSAWQKQSRSCDSMAAIQGSPAIITLGDEPAVIRGVDVSAGFFKTLGVVPAAGRVFSPEEQLRAGHHVAILSHRLAQSLGGQMVGKTVPFSRQPHVIVGVMPPQFGFPNDSEVWFPLPADDLAGTPAGDHNFRVIARLKAGATVVQAQSEMQAIASPLQQAYAPVSGAGVAVVPLREQIVGEARRTLLALLAVVVCLLLIACANVANLLLSRAAGRWREIALRLSLGSSRLRVVRYLLAESVVLALVGAALGLAGAYLGVRAFVASNPIELPRVQEITIDFGVLLLTLVAALSTALLVSLALALRVSRLSVNAALKQAGGQVAGDFRSNRVRSVLAMVQVALAMVMLTACGLLLRSFVERVSVPLGFQPDGTLGVELPWAAHRRIDELLERIRALPGVQVTGAGTAFPLEPPGTTGGFEIENRAKMEAESPMAGKMVVTPDFFRAAGIALRKGRFTTMADAAEAPKVAVISEALARRYFANEEPIGKRIRWGGPWLTVVGVVGDVNGFGVDGPPLPAIYLPHGQQSWDNGVFVLVRTAVPPASLAATVRREIRSWNKSILISRLAPLEDLLSASVVAPRSYMLLVAAFAAIAVVIAAVGVYGTLNYLVTQRTHEIGVRMALGANRSDLLCSIVGRGLTVILTGLIFGLAGAWAFTGVLESLLFRVRPNDTATFFAASLLLVAVGLLACYVPARRATKIDPMEALRYE